MAVPPVSAMGRGAHEHQARLRWGRRLITSALLAAVALLASQARPVDGMPLWGYAAALLAGGPPPFAPPAMPPPITPFTPRALRPPFGAEGLPARPPLTALLSRPSLS